MHRSNVLSSHQRRVLGTYVLVSTVAAASLGAALGVAGDAVPTRLRVALAALLSLVAIAAAATELRSNRFSPMQCDRETPRRWVDHGAFAWAFLNGAALGTGGLTRLGFCLWYAIPAGALLLGDPVAGATLYGLYGLARSAAAWGILVVGRSIERIDAVLLLRNSLARRAAAVHLLCLGTATAVGVGL